MMRLTHIALLALLLTAFAFAGCTDSGDGLDSDSGDGDAMDNSTADGDDSVGDEEGNEEEGQETLTVFANH